jgi:hypothetical protein
MTLVKHPLWANVGGAVSVSAADGKWTVQATNFQYDVAAAARSG